MVQRQQQAPAQAGHRSAARWLVAGSDGESAGHVRLQLAGRSAGRHSDLVHAHALPSRAQFQHDGGRDLARRFVPPHQSPAVPVWRAGGCQPVPRYPRAQHRGGASAWCTQRSRAQWRVREPAGWLLVAVRHGPADRRVRWRLSWPARSRAWRHRRVSEHAAGHAGWFGHRQYRAGQRDSAACLRGASHTDSRLERVRQSCTHSDALCRRQHGHRVLQRRPERDVVREGLCRAQQPAVEPELVGAGALEPRQCQLRRHILAQHASVELRGSQFRRPTAFCAGQRGRSSGVRAAQQYRADDRCHRRWRRPRGAAIPARDGATQRSQFAECTRECPPVADELQHELQLEHQLHVFKRARAVPRLHEHGR